MSEILDDIPDAPADATIVEKADVAVAKAVAPISRSPAMRVLGVLSDVSDQPPMRILCAGVIGWGLYRGDRRLVLVGVRMIAAHSVATGMKTLVKHRVDRTRPTLLVEEGRYEMAPGQSREHDESSFPSGHTAGAVAVAAAVAHDYPEAGPAAYAAAAVIAALQIPRCTHYASDVGAGAIVGLAAAAGVNAAGDYLEDMAERREPEAKRAAPAR